MKTLTISIEEHTLSKAHQIAEARYTSVNALVVEFLEQLVTHKSRKEEPREALLQFCENPSAINGARNWSREEIYDS